MTLPNERRMAIIRTEDFLLSLLDPKKTPGVPKAIREEARRCLRHFPSKYYMDRASELAPTIFGEWDSEYRTSEEHSPYYYDFDRNK